MNKLLIICGPTATGKTSLGIRLAKKFGGEIVSADSRQVYKGMDVGTGKELPKTAKLKVKSEKLKVKVGDNQILKPYRFSKIPVWFLDIVKPSYRFSVADYLKCANLVIKDIWKRKKLPILVGGTGFYIKAVIDGVETIGVKADWKLRKELSNCSIVQLSNLLKKIDIEKWRRMNQSDRKNPRRLIRAIEIALSDKKTVTLTRLDSSALTRRGWRQARQGKLNNTEDTDKDVMMIGLTTQNEILYQRIDKRVDGRVKQGIIGEIKRLLKMGYSWENSVLGETIGYQEWRKCFAGSRLEGFGDELSRIVRGSRIEKETIQKWKYDEHGYARRQMTWFKKDKRIHWFDISEKGWENKLEKLVTNWICPPK